MRVFFRELLKQRDLPNIKPSDFKSVVGPLIREQFDLALRNDLDGAGVRGWKNVRLVQAGPGKNLRPEKRRERTGKMTCKQFAREDNHEKGQALVVAGNQMGNVK
jgi:hypothetical protein